MAAFGGNLGPIIFMVGLVMLFFTGRKGEPARLVALAGILLFARGDAQSERAPHSEQRGRTSHATASPAPRGAKRPDTSVPRPGPRSTNPVGGPRRPACDTVAGASRPGAGRVYA